MTKPGLGTSDKAGDSTRKQEIDDTTKFIRDDLLTRMEEKERREREREEKERNVTRIEQIRDTLNPGKPSDKVPPTVDVGHELWLVEAGHKIVNAYKVAEQLKATGQLEKVKLTHLCDTIKSASDITGIAQKLLGKDTFAADVIADKLGAAKKVVAVLDALKKGFEGDAIGEFLKSPEDPSVQERLVKHVGEFFKTASNAIPETVPGLPTAYLKGALKAPVHYMNAYMNIQDKYIRREGMPDFRQQYLGSADKPEWVGAMTGIYADVWKHKHPGLQEHFHGWRQRMATTGTEVWGLPEGAGRALLIADIEKYGPEDPAIKTKWIDFIQDHPWKR